MGEVGRGSIKQAIHTELERHEATIGTMPDLHSVSFTVYVHGEKTECVVEYRAQAPKRLDKRFV